MADGTLDPLDISAHPLFSNDSVTFPVPSNLASQDSIPGVISWAVLPRGALVDSHFGQFVTRVPSKTV